MAEKNHAADDTLPNVDDEQSRPIEMQALLDAPRSIHKPRVLMLYGSLRERSYSRLATEEAARISCAVWVPRCVSSIPRACRSPIRHLPIIRRSRNCGICRFGRRPRSGALRNGTGL